MNFEESFLIKTNFAIQILNRRAMALTRHVGLHQGLSSSSRLIQWLWFLIKLSVVLLLDFPQPMAKMEKMDCVSNGSSIFNLDLNFETNSGPEHQRSGNQFRTTCCITQDLE